MSKNKRTKVILSRSLRKKPTIAESKLWKYLNNRGLCNCKFRRQHIIKGFILDFYCPSKKIGIELDGAVHACQEDYDKARQEVIERNGVKMLRFRNEEILNDIESVLKVIKRNAFPSPRSGEGWPDEYRAGVRS